MSGATKLASPMTSLESRARAAIAQARVDARLRIDGWLGRQINKNPSLGPLADAALLEAVSMTRYTPRRRDLRNALVELELPGVTDTEVAEYLKRAAANEAAAHDTRGT